MNGAMRKGTQKGGDFLPGHFVVERLFPRARGTEKPKPPETRCTRNRTEKHAAGLQDAIYLLNRAFWEHEMLKYFGRNDHRK